MILSLIEEKEKANLHLLIIDRNIQIFIDHGKSM